MCASDRHGFTLIELSIVLVIIGLIVGGILVGRDLIHAAELQRTVRQLDTFASAIQTFRLKFNCLPGDCATEATFGFGTSGNGSGIVLDSVSEWSEYQNFWTHLYAANLIADSMITLSSPNLPDPTLTCPAIKLSAAHACFLFLSKYSNFMGVRGEDWLPGPNMFWISSSADPANPAMALSPADSYFIDQKLDDGLPYSGTVRAAGSYSDNLNADPPATDCADFGTNGPYNITSTNFDPGSLCSLAIQGQF